MRTAILSCNVTDERADQVTDAILALFQDDEMAADILGRIIRLIMDLRRGSASGHVMMGDRVLLDEQANEWYRRNHARCDEQRLAAKQAALQSLAFLAGSN